MSTVLDEVTDDSLDAAYILRRVDDWEERLGNLYAQIGDWLPQGWTASEGPPVRMYEEMMHEFGVAPRSLPTLELASRSGGAAKLEPRGLWIIGANGRVDLRSDSHHYLIVDAAENFEKSNWQAAPIEHRCDQQSVTRDWLRHVLR